MLERSNPRREEHIASPGFIGHGRIRKIDVQTIVCSSSRLHHRLMKKTGLLQYFKAVIQSSISIATEPLKFQISAP
jgi:beta-phosphoglucomutase-like phosphatase (HAD superfamily)